MSCSTDSVGRSLYSRCNFTSRTRNALLSAVNQWPVARSRYVQPPGGIIEKLKILAMVGEFLGNQVRGLDGPLEHPAPDAAAGLLGLRAGLGPFAAEEFDQHDERVTVVGRSADPGPHLALLLDRNLLLLDRLVLAGDKVLAKEPELLDDATDHP